MQIWMTVFRIFLYFNYILLINLTSKRKDGKLETDKALFFSPIFFLIYSKRLILLSVGVCMLVSNKENVGKFCCVLSACLLCYEDNFKHLCKTEISFYTTPKPLHSSWKNLNTCLSKGSQCTLNMKCWDSVSMWTACTEAAQQMSDPEDWTVR